MWDSGTIIRNNLTSNDREIFRLLGEVKIAIQESRYSDAYKFILEAKNLIKKPKRKRR